MLVVGHYGKTMKGFIENIKFHKLISDIVEVKEKKLKTVISRLFDIDFL